MTLDEAVLQLRKLKASDRMWLFRVHLSRNGLGRWNDMPKILRSFITEHVDELLATPSWCEVQMALLAQYNRTWSSNAVARHLLIAACYEAWSTATACFRMTNAKNRDGHQSETSAGPGA